MDAGKFLRKYLRKTHRWLALPFAALIVVVLVTRDSALGVGIQQAQQVLLLVMALTGLYLFLLPWWTKWKRAGTRPVEALSRDRVRDEADGQRLQPSGASGDTSRPNPGLS